MFSEAFDSIDKDETKFEPSRAAAPKFGDSMSSYPENVRVFYNYWINFSSGRSFAWKDVYNTTQAPNRDVRRVMEKENKRERDKARRGFNELVRRLAEFARKKDPRVMNWAKEQATQKAEREEMAKVNKVRQAEGMRNLKEAARAAQQEQLDSIDLSGMDPSLLMSEKDLKKHKHLLNGSASPSAANDDVSEEEDIVEEYYCPACKKLFKSDKQFKNHENSKKHKELAAKLRKELLAEEKAAAASQPATSTPTVVDALEEEEDQYMHNLDALRHTDDLVHTALDDESDSDESISHEEDEAILHTIENLDKYKLHDHPSSTMSEANPTAMSHEQSEAGLQSDDGDDEDMLSMMANSKSKNRFAFDEDSDGADVEPLPKPTGKGSFNFAEFESSLASVSDSPSPNKSGHTSTASSSISPDAAQDAPGKKKRRRAVKEKPATPPTAPTVASKHDPGFDIGEKRPGKGKKGAKNQHQEEESGFSCRTCGSAFPSKTALHAHLKETKHAIAT